LREMLYLYRKNEACETKRQKERTTQKMKQQRDGGGERYDMDPLFVIALLLFSAI
jgi:hypothetical protein